MFGLTFEKLLLIGVIAAFLLGPERLPVYAQKLGELVRKLRGFTSGAKERMREEMGPEFDEVDWRKLDPRQYDPRRIIRDALLDDPLGANLTAPIDARAAGGSVVSLGAAGSSGPARREPPLPPGTPAPFDSEAT